jgi:hypothetical protein
MSAPLSNRATLESFERLLAAKPQLDRCARLSDFVAIADRTLLHAGPPLQAGVIPPPLLNSAVAAALLEGWARDEAQARDAIVRGIIRLVPAQDYGVVTPLAFVVSPSMWVLGVSDAVGKAPPRYAPVNDGPPPAALRFGARQEGQAERLALLAQVGPALSVVLREPIPVLPILRAGLDGGDDLHGRVTAANTALTEILAPRLADEAADYLTLANQFVLNVVMATCAVMIGAGADVADSLMVIAAGGNGVDFGWQLADAPTIWNTSRAQAPVGPHFPHAAGRRFLPAIGDSAAIDACGFGAAALRYAPEMVAALRGHVPDAYFSEAVSAPFLGAHPMFPPDLRLGLHVDHAKPVRGVMLAAIDAEGEAGLVGRGIAPWPQS